MAKTWIAVLISVIAIGVLALLIVNSRSIGVQDYNSHYQRLGTIDQSVANYESLLDQLSAARRDGRPTGSGVSLMRARLNANVESLSRNSNSAVDAGYTSAFDAEVKKVIQWSTEAENHQNIVGNALQQIRDNGPREVQRMKAAGFEGESQGFYKLMLKAMAYGTPGNTTGEEEMTTAISAFKQNDNLLSTSVLGMVDAIERVVSTRGPADETWKALSTSKFTQITSDLRNSFSSAHSVRTRDVETARILLSVFSVVLFGGLGLLGYRLQNSYREINTVNNQLVDANGSLEQRVEERTQDLEHAFSELKESQVQLVQAEKMSSLGQLVAGISHEINTPLLYLQSNQTLIKETLGRVSEFIELCHHRLVPRAMPTEDKEVVRQRYVQGLHELKTMLIDEEIKVELEEVVSLTNDNIEGLEELTIMAQGLKDFSRLDRAPIDEFNVNDGIERTLVIGKNVLKNKVNVIKNLGDVPKVTCSPSQINQIFLNLITNAAQAIEDTGDITISTFADKGYVSVAIKDTGCGIPEEIMAKIRDPFFTTKEVGTGTGLGLSIVEEILNSHNGRLDIQSEVGKGSIFTVLLPYQAQGEGNETNESGVDFLLDAEDNSEDSEFVALTG